ncbi:hypothetical protein HDV02_002406, partial [Globomyces sp. JEL0801]
MSDQKYFQRGKVHELQQELQFDKKDTKNIKKKHALKKVIANMTMGNDMSPLAADVIACISLQDLEIKKMVYLFVVTYCKYKPELAIAAMNSIAKDTQDENPLIRALAIRNMSNLPVDKVMNSLCEPLKKALSAKDPYVAKTASLAVAKLFYYNEDLVRKEGYLEQLKSLLSHENANVEHIFVVANTLVALMDIASNSDLFEFAVDVPTANRLLSILDECSEWSQCYILEAVLTVCPEDPLDAELLCDRVSPRLQHSNSSVVMAAVRIMIYLSSFLTNPIAMKNFLKKCGPPLVTQLHARPEIQYVALKNIQLILQKHKDFLKNEIKVFFCKYNDPIYVKLSKLEIMFQLADETNIFTVLAELKEYASEIDIDFVRKSVRSIGRCAIKIATAADKCVETLVEMIQTKVDYVVQEAIIVIKDIFRKYPNRFESVISVLCENLGSLEEPEAKSSMIWIIGQYADRIENAHELLTVFLDTFKEDVPMVQLSLLTAVVKLFIKRPTVGQSLVPRILKYSTEEVDNPDLRDRGFMYWRLLSSDPLLAKQIILCEKPTITTESENLDGAILSRLLYNISTLASLTYRPPKMNSALCSRLLRLHEESCKVLSLPTIPVVENKVNVAPMANPYQTQEFEAKNTRDLLGQMSQLAINTNTVHYTSDLPLDLFDGDYSNNLRPVSPSALFTLDPNLVGGGRSQSPVQMIQYEQSGPVPITANAVQFQPVSNPMGYNTLLNNSSPPRSNTIGSAVPLSMSIDKNTNNQIRTQSLGPMAPSPTNVNMAFNPFSGVPNTVSGDLLPTAAPIQPKPPTINNPFAPVSVGQGVQSHIQSSGNYNLTASADVTLDPFAQTSVGGGIVVAKPPQTMATPSPIVQTGTVANEGSSKITELPISTFLSSQLGRGLEIKGK